MSGGISGSVGSVANAPASATDVTATFNQESFSFITDGTALTESLMFRLGTASPTTATRVLQLGFLTSPVSAFNGGAQQPTTAQAGFARLRINTPAAAGASYRIEGQDKATSSATPGAFSGQDIALTNETWYRLTITLTNTAGTNAYSISGLVENQGADGVTPTGVPFVFAPVMRTLTGVDATLHGGFRAAGANNVTNYDIFTVVPEPTAGLMLVSGMALLGVRRRRVAGGR